MAQNPRDFLSASRSQKRGWWQVGVQVEIKGKSVRDLLPADRRQLASVPPPWACVLFTSPISFHPGGRLLWGTLEVLYRRGCLVVPTPRQSLAPPRIPTVLPAGLSWFLSPHRNCLTVYLFHQTLSPGGQELCPRQLVSFTVYGRSCLLHR